MGDLGMRGEGLADAVQAAGAAVIQRTAATEWPNRSALYSVSMYTAPEARSAFSRL